MTITNIHIERNISAAIIFEEVLPVIKKWRLSISQMSILLNSTKRHILAVRCASLGSDVAMLNQQVRADDLASL
jgi:hypothetical protein